MSYILDALKKADAQRERDPARGIHAQPASPAGGAHPPRDGYRAWFWGAGAAGLAVMASVAWYVHQDRDAVAVRAVVAATPAPGPAATPAVVPVTPPPAPVATTVLPPPPVTPALESPRDPRNTSQPTMRGRPQPAATVSQAAVPYGPPAGVAPAPAAAASLVPAAPPAVTPGGGRPPAAAASPAPVAPAAPDMPVAPMPPAPPMTASPRAPVVVPMPPVAGLPPDAPKLVVTGGVYSNNPAQRMLIVNGQVFSQGADLGAGVTLEEIKPKAAVLTFRGARYSVAY